MAMAIRASVTVSIAAETSGIRSVMLRDRRAVVSTSLGTTSVSAGSSSTSSNVSPSGANLLGRNSSSGRVWGVMRRWYLDSHRSRPCTVFDVHSQEMPPDPFADDPDDPARSLADMDDEPAPPLTEEERAELLADLQDLQLYQRLLEPRGIRGIVVDCADCNEPHYHESPLPRARREPLPTDGQAPPRQPGLAAHPPDPRRRHS